MKAKIAVTGASGFLGRHLVKAFNDEGVEVFPISRATGYDLRDPIRAYEALRVSKADVVIHLAATVGGIGANMRRPATFFYENMTMGMNIVEAATKFEKKLIFLGTICSYPKFCPVPFKEADLWNGYPEETNAPYGIAKKALMVMCQAYRKEHGLRYGYLLPCNLYGPHDNFDEGSSHVIPAIIKRYCDAKKSGLPEVTCWGTGAATRSFLYAADAARAIVRAVEILDSDDPINLPGSEEITMKALASLISELSGYRGTTKWDPTKPDGQPKRAVDGTRAKEVLGWEPTTTLAAGLRETIDWYLKNKPAK